MLDKKFYSAAEGFFFIISNRIYEVFLMICAFIFHYCHSQIEKVWILLLCGKLLVLYAAWNQIMIAHEKVGKRRKDLYENMTCSGCGANTFTSCSFLVFLPKKIFNTNGVAYTTPLWMAAQVYRVIYCYSSGSHWDSCMFDLDDSISPSPLF